jgi:hypothetical protein
MVTSARMAAISFTQRCHIFASSALSAITKGLEDAYALNPEDAENTLLLTHANLWTIAESSRDPSFKQADFQKHAAAAQQHFERENGVR